MAKVLRADMSPKAMEEFARGGKTGNEYKKKATAHYHDSKVGGVAALCAMFGGDSEQLTSPKPSKPSWLERVRKKLNPRELGRRALAAVAGISLLAGGAAATAQNMEYRTEAQQTTIAADETATRQEVDGNLQADAELLGVSVAELQDFKDTYGLDADVRPFTPEAAEAMRDDKGKAQLENQYAVGEALCVKEGMSAEECFVQLKTAAAHNPLLYAQLEAMRSGVRVTDAGYEAMLNSIYRQISDDSKRYEQRYGRLMENLSGKDVRVALQEDTDHSRASVWYDSATGELVTAHGVPPQGSYLVVTIDGVEYRVRLNCGGQVTVELGGGAVTKAAYVTQANKTTGEVELVPMPIPTPPAKEQPPLVPHVPDNPSTVPPNPPENPPVIPPGIPPATPPKDIPPSKIPPKLEGKSPEPGDHKKPGNGNEQDAGQGEAPAAPAPEGGPTGAAPDVQDTEKGASDPKQPGAEAGTEVAAPDIEQPVASEDSIAEQQPTDQPAVVPAPSNNVNGGMVNPEIIARPEAVSAPEAEQPAQKVEAPVDPAVELPSQSDLLWSAQQPAAETTKN